jgi:hypothetical protein
MLYILLGSISFVTLAENVGKRHLPPLVTIICIGNNRNLNIQYHNMLSR